MKSKARKKSKSYAVTKPIAGRSLGCIETERVAHALDIVLRDSGSKAIPIEEQLRQCPDAFKAGELLERTLNSLKYDQDEVSQAERWLPPAGAVIPPIV
jgi:hypothetical protein